MQQKKSRRGLQRALIIVLCLLVIAVVALLIVGSKIWTLTKIEKEPVSSTIVDDGFYIDDLYRGRTAIPEYDIPLNTYAHEKFKEKDGYLTYDDANAVIGIDVSNHQKQIDWEQVKASGVNFAIIRAGFRGYTAGGMVEDEWLQTNLEGASNAGIDIGLYFFSQAITVEEAEAEAEFILERAKSHTIKYPIYYDWESITEFEPGSVPRTANCSQEQVTSFTKAFCEKVKLAGYKPGFYTNKNSGYSKFNLEELKEYDFWYAEYQSLPSFYYNFSMWQYTESGTIAGIEGNVDINIAFKKF